MMPGRGALVHVTRIYHAPKYLVCTLRNLVTFSQFSSFSIAQDSCAIRCHSISNSLGSASTFPKFLSSVAQPPHVPAASIGAIPQSIQDVLRVISQGFKNLEVGVSHTAQILEMLNQVMNAITALPKRSTDDLPVRVFSHPTIVSFLENSVMKSVRRFTPDDVMKVCLITSRAERLGITTLRDLLRQSLEVLIDKGEAARRKHNESDGSRESDSTHAEGESAAGQSSCKRGDTIAGLTVSKYCQLPIILSLCHQSETLELEFIERVINWMADVVRISFLLCVI